MTRLNEFDKDEWFDGMKRIRPELKREDFESVWARFQRDKAEHRRKLGLS